MCCPLSCGVVSYFRGVRASLLTWAEGRPGLAPLPTIPRATRLTEAPKLRALGSESLGAWMTKRMPLTRISHSDLQ